jgi:molecular chaperone DnaJ
MRVEGKGVEGAKGFRAGDLYIQLNVSDDRYFKRSGLDLTVELAVPFVQAVLGGTAEVLALSTTPTYTDILVH